MKPELILFVACAIITLLASRRTLRPVEAVIDALLGRPMGEQDDTPSFFDIFLGGFSMGYVSAYLALESGSIERLLEGSADVYTWALILVQLFVIGILVSFFLKIYWRERIFLAVMTSAGILTALFLLSEASQI